MLTDLFPPEIKPARPGVYETWVPLVGFGFQFWTGQCWCSRASTAYWATVTPLNQSRVAPAPYWRGLNFDPVANP